MYNIVLAEDDEYMARILLVFLKTSGYNLKRFRNGLEVFKYLETSPQVDLLITDVLMPEMNGFELLGKLKEINRLPTTMIISGQRREDEVVQGLNYGITDYILKPVSPKVVVAKIKNLLDRKAAEAVA